MQASRIGLTMADVRTCSLRSSKKAQWKRLATSPFSCHSCSKKYLWNPWYLCEIIGRFAQNFSKISKNRKRRKSETRAFSLSHGAVVSPMREVHRRLGGETHGDIKSQKISVKSVLSVWHKNMPYPCDEVREFFKKMRESFIEMRKRCFFKPSAENAITTTIKHARILHFLHPLLKLR